jgi:hypothetical protein
MNPTKEKYYRSLFAIAAIYDFLLGIIFTFFPRWAFNALGIGEKFPAFAGYLTLLGAFVMAIGFAYFLIARGDLQRNRDLILVGVLYKLAYSATAIFYWSKGELPHVAFGAVFGLADAIFFLLMAECWASLKKRS